MGPRQLGDEPPCRAEGRDPPRVAFESQDSEPSPTGDPAHLCAAERRSRCPPTQGTASHHPQEAQRQNQTAVGLRTRSKTSADAHHRAWPARRETSPGGPDGHASCKRCTVSAVLVENEVQDQRRCAPQSAACTKRSRPRRARVGVPADASGGGIAHRCATSEVSARNGGMPKANPKATNVPRSGGRYGQR